MSTDLIVVPKPMELPVVVLQAEIVDRANGLTILATEMKVDDVFALTAADSTMIECRGLLKAVEAERVRVKAPFLDIGKQIDAAAAGVADKLTIAAKSLQSRIFAYQQEQNRLRVEAEAEANRKREEAEARQRAEQARIDEEARKKAQEAKDKGTPPPAPVVRPVMAPIAPVYVPPVVKSTSTTVTKKTVLIVDDINLIPREIAGVTLLVLDESAALKLLKAGVTIPGCHKEEKEVPRGI